MPELVVGQLPDILVTGDPEERKAVVRVFLQEIRIEKDDEAGGPALAPPASCR